jgi:hypothetical protein
MIATRARRLIRIGLNVWMIGCAGHRGPEHQQPEPAAVMVPPDVPSVSPEPAPIVVAEPAQGETTRPAASAPEAESTGLPRPPPAAARVTAENDGIFPLMPSQCRTRIYVNVAGLLGSDAPRLSTVLDKLAQLDSHGKATKALRAVRDGGLDPVLALREIAFCDQPDLSVMRVQPSRPTDGLAALQAALVALGEKAVLVRWGSMRVVWAPPRQELVVEVTPAILLWAQVSANAEAALSELAGESGFAAARGRLLWIGGRQSETVVSETVRTLSLVTTLGTEEALAGDPGAPARHAAEVHRDLDRMARDLDRSPLAPLAPKMRAAQVGTAGQDVVVRAKLSRAELNQLIRHLAAAKPTAFSDLLR